MDQLTRSAYGTLVAEASVGAATGVAFIAAVPGKRIVVDSQIVSSAGAAIWQLKTATLNGPILRILAASMAAVYAQFRAAVGEAVTVDVTTSTCTAYCEYHLED